MGRSYSEYDQRRYENVADRSTNYVLSSEPILMALFVLLLKRIHFLALTIALH